MQSWATAEFSGSDLPDVRFHRSLARNAEALASSSGASFSVACGDDGRQAARRLFRHENTTSKGLLKGHLDQTVKRCKDTPLVIAVQDTMVFEQNGHLATEGLGPITVGSNSRGLMVHSVLAMNPDGLPLGVLHLDIWARKPKVTPKRSNYEVPVTEKESNKWLVALRATAKALPKDQEVLIVSDRESEVFDLLAVRRRSTVNLLIRACHERRVHADSLDSAETAVLTTLTKAMNETPIAGDLIVDIPRKPGQSQRQVTLSVQFRTMAILPPKSGIRRKSVKPQRVTVIQVIERSPPEGVAAISWLLFSTKPVTDLQAACDMVRYYTLRWTIERLHYTLKSGGLNVERLQVDDVTALKNSLVLYYVVAWRVLYLTYLVRTNPDDPAHNTLTDTEITVLKAVSKRSLVTLEDAVREIAILAGHPRWANSPKPGVKRITQGLTILNTMTNTWLIALDQMEM